MIVTRHKKIAAGGTIPLIAQTIALKQIVLSCSNAGTTWVVRIEDNAANPAIILPNTTMAIPTNGLVFYEYWETPLPMDGGLDFVTDSGTFGEADLWFSFEQPSTTV